MKWSQDKLGGTADRNIRPNAKISFALGFFIFSGGKNDNRDFKIERGQSQVSRND